MKSRYARVALKISGEALLGKKSHGIDFEFLEGICKEIVEVKKKLSVKMVITIGAGNIWRARDKKDTGIDRVYSDIMGMLGTIMNAVAMQSMLEKLGSETRIASAIDIPQLAEPYIRRRVMRHLEKDRIVIMAGGTGNPYFTTDTAAALRALELKCDVLLKASNIDGVYNLDPKKSAKAKRFEKISFSDVLEKDLKFMDGSAVSLCRESKLPIIVFDLNKKGNILKSISTDGVGTLIS